ncbi:hypothetical protein NC652_004870 [Populus alba x Populus x berolinensis]|nr:hypothetical protein NC652_004870 [Populus alba x Populus x berolinensis]
MKESRKAQALCFLIGMSGWLPVSHHHVRSIAPINLQHDKANKQCSLFCFQELML